MLGQGRAVILRSHGALVAEKSVEGLFLASYCLEDNAKKLFDVYQLGQPQVQSSEEIEEYQNDVYTDRLFSKAWSYYRSKANISF